VAEKDITEKILLSYADVFADVVNGLLFKGEQILQPEDLVDQAPRAIYKADGKIREIERDVAKRWQKNSIRIACIGFENETDPDPDMPLRVICYDGAEYRVQLLKENLKKSRYPVVTLVLYFGYRKHWDAPVRLHEAVDIPEIFKPYVPDFRINVFEIAYLTDEQLGYFHSDFRVVADYFVQKQRNGDYIPSRDKLQHVEAVLQLLSVMTEDNRFEDVLYESDGSGGGVNNMCDVLDRVEAKGVSIGEKKGESRLAALMDQLLSQGRVEDARKAAKDENFRARLFKEFRIP
jgi:hypothetical protein